MSRLKFDHAEVMPVGDELCRVDTEFTFSGKLIQTSATGKKLGTGPLMAAASATLRAIEEATDGKMEATLEDIDRLNAVGKEVVAVLVNVKFEGQQSQFFGSCQIGEDKLDAAVKAALNATNRCFELVVKSY